MMKKKRMRKFAAVRVTRATERVPGSTIGVGAGRQNGKAVGDDGEEVSSRAAAARGVELVEQQVRDLAVGKRSLAQRLEQTRDGAFLRFVFAAAAAARPLVALRVGGGSLVFTGLLLLSPVVLEPRQQLEELLRGVPGRPAAQGRQGDGLVDRQQPLVRLHRLVARVVVAEGQQAVLLGRELELLLALLRGLDTEVKESNGGLVTIEKPRSVMSGSDGDGDEANNDEPCTCCD
jgi:hypothetical protein